MVNDYENTIPNLNSGRLTAMRWCYAAITLLLCCINETVCIFLVLVHAVIFVAWFLNRDTSHFVSEKIGFQNSEKAKSAQAAYQKELDAQKPCWFDQFVVPITVDVPIEMPQQQQVKLSSRQEEIWQQGFNDESNTVELDVSVSSAARTSFQHAWKNSIDFEIN